MRRLKHVLRDAAAETLFGARVTHPSRRARGRLSIATFHRVLPAPLLAQYPLPSLAVTPEELGRFLAIFKQHYAVGTLAESVRLHLHGAPTDKPPLAITFDDGQIDNHRYALPVLDAHDVRASFFVVTDATQGNQTLWHDRVAFSMQQLAQRDAGALRGWLGELGVPGATAHPVGPALEAAKRLDPETRERHVERLEALAGGDAARPEWDGMMTWDHLRGMQASGHEIGSHSVSHPILPLVPDAQLRVEIGRSKALLEEALDREVRSFCYPNGDHDNRVVASVREAGYAFAVTTRYGINAPGSDPYRLRRVDLQSGYGKNAAGRLTAGGLFLRMSGLMPGMA